MRRNNIANDSAITRQMLLQVQKYSKSNWPQHEIAYTFKEWIWICKLFTIHNFYTYNTSDQLVVRI